MLGFSLPTREAVDEIYAHLIGAGHNGHQQPYDAFWGARYAIIEDPDGKGLSVINALVWSSG